MVSQPVNCYFKSSSREEKNSTQVAWPKHANMHGTHLALGYIRDDPCQVNFDDLDQWGTAMKKSMNQMGIRCNKRRGKPIWWELSIKCRD